MSRSRSVIILNRADSCHLEQCLILVTIDGAGDGVKDLEHYNGPAPTFSPQILHCRMTVRGRSE